MKRFSQPYDRNRLEKAALHYLERYEATGARLAEVLKRKLLRSHPESPLNEEEQGWIEEIAARCAGLGYVDDRRFAESKARGSVHVSRRRLGAMLRAKGVAQDAASAAMALAYADDPAKERRALAHLAERKRLGPFASGQADGSEKAAKKAFGILMRAGFDYSAVREFLACPDREAVDEWIAGGFS